MEFCGYHFGYCSVDGGIGGEWGGKVGLIGSFVESVNVASRGWRL